MSTYIQNMVTIYNFFGIAFAFNQFHYITITLPQFIEYFYTSLMLKNELEVSKQFTLCVV